MCDRKAGCLWASLRAQLGIALDDSCHVWPPATAAVRRGLILAGDGCETNEKLFRFMMSQFLNGDGGVTDDAEIGSDWVAIKQLCLQHALQLVKSRVSTLLELQTPLFCIAKQFSGSLMVSNLLDAVYACIDSRLEWKKAGSTVSVDVL